MRKARFVFDINRRLCNHHNEVLLMKRKLSCYRRKTNCFPTAGVKYHPSATDLPSTFYKFVFSHSAALAEKKLKSRLSIFDDGML